MTDTLRYEVEIDTAIVDAYDDLTKINRKLQAEEHKYVVDPVAVANLKGELGLQNVVVRNAEACYTGWSRFFLVTNSGGHIHRDQSCTTCFPTTQYGWLYELSGLTEAEAVEEYGEILCSICYPSAPVEWTNGVNKKDAERKALDKALKAIARTPEGHKVKTATELVRSKTYRMVEYERAIERFDEAVFLGIENPAWVTRDRDRALAELPKVYKQLARAEAKLADAQATLTAALEVS